jgi:hypothetical protein
MAIVLGIIAFVAWVFLHAHMDDLGIAPRSRGSLRYQRRKARKLGVDPQSVTVNARVPSHHVASPYDPAAQKITTVQHLARGLMLVVVMLMALVFWVGAAALMGLSPNLIFVGVVAVFGIWFWLVRKHDREFKSGR